MSKGVGSVKTVLLEEEPRPGVLVRRASADVASVGRRVTGPSTGRERSEGGQGRPQAARRGSLDGPVVVDRIMDVEARQGFAGAATGRAGDACAGRLQFPTGCEDQAGPSSAAWSCLRRDRRRSGMELSGAASSAQSLGDDPPVGGHAVTRAVCLLRPSRLSSPQPARGNGSLRPAGRSRRAGASF